MKGLKGRRVKEGHTFYMPGLKPGYFYRDEKRIVHFVSTSENNCEVVSGGGDAADPFVLIPQRHLALYVGQGDIAGVQKEWHQLHERLVACITEGTIEELFFPYGIDEYRVQPKDVKELRFAYFVAGTEVHQHYHATGEYDQSWLRVLGLAAFSRGCNVILSPWAYPTAYLALMYQIFDAETREDFARILGVVRMPAEGEQIVIPKAPAYLPKAVAA